MRTTAKQWALALVNITATATENQVQEAAKLLVESLAKEQRLDQLPKILRAIDRVWRERFGTSSVHVQSAYPLPKAVYEKLETLAQGADLKTTVDPNLIGGAVVRLDQQLIDGSIAGALTRLSSAFIHGS